MNKRLLQSPVVALCLMYIYSLSFVSWRLKEKASRELIARFLEQIKKKGIGQFLLFDSRGYWNNYNESTGPIPVLLTMKYEFMPPGWRQMVNPTMQEASSLG